MRLGFFAFLTMGFFASCGGGGSSTPNPPATPSPTAVSTGSSAGWPLAWSDEFDGAAGVLPDPAKWVMETGGGGFGNNELEYYTERAKNVAHDGNGQLVIHALLEHYTGSDGVTREYTSARLKTEGLFDQAYGKFTSRMQIPRGQGLWPAFWMLGANHATVPWPGCGELDIMENVGNLPNRVVGSMHGPGYFGASPVNKAIDLPAPVADDYHVFTLEWEPSAIRWYVDDTLYQSRGPADLGTNLWVFDHPFFIIMNVAVGGNWPGSPDATTVFPQTMPIDYVRVYKRS